MERKIFFPSGRLMLIGLLLVFGVPPATAFAASVSINYGFGPDQNAAAEIVAPKDSTKSVATPVFSTVQSTTELDTTKTTAIEPVPAATESRGQARLPMAVVGIDSYFSDRQNIYSIPLSYSFFTDIYAQLNIPIVSAKYDLNGASSDNTGIGDINLTIKHVYGSEESVELYSMGTVSFATGDEDKGLGSGAYVLSLTEKGVKRFGDYRCTLMGGVSVPVNDPKILGSTVSYGTSFSYMAAIERTLFDPNLWFSLRAAGVHLSESKIDGVGAGNSLTTLDIVPGIRFATRFRTSLQLALFVPVYTAYDVAGATSRDVVVNFGVVKSF